MLITKTKDLMVIKSIQGVKLFAAVVAVGIGLGIIAMLFLPGADVNLHWLGVLAGLVFVATGVVIARDVKYSVTRLSRRGISTIKERKLTSVRSIDFKIADILAVEKLEYVGPGNGSHGPNDLLRLKIDKRGKVEIAASYNRSLYARFRRPLRKEGQKIAEFVGVELYTQQTNLFQEFLKNPKNVDSTTRD